MNLRSFLSVTAISMLLFTSCADSYESAPAKHNDAQEAGGVQPVAVTKTNSMQVYAHYMPLRHLLLTLRMKESGVIIGQ